MAEPAQPSSLYAAIERLPEGVVGEIIDGRLHTHPRPAGPHVRAAASLFAEISGPFDRGRNGPGGWQILPEPEIHFRRDAEVLVPDLAGWHRSRLPRVPEDQRFEVVPDWVCEVLSPSTAVTDRQMKMAVYARYGVAYAWLADPRTSCLEAYALDRDDWRQIGAFTGEVAICAAPFDHIAIPSPWT